MEWYPVEGGCCAGLTENTLFGDQARPRKCGVKFHNVREARAPARSFPLSKALQPNFEFVAGPGFERHRLRQYGARFADAGLAPAVRGSGRLRGAKWDSDAGCGSRCLLLPYVPKWQHTRPAECRS